MVKLPSPATETPELVMPTETIIPTEMKQTASVQPSVNQETRPDRMLLKDAGCTLFFSSLLGIGIILVVLSISNRAK